MTDPQEATSAETPTEPTAPERPVVDEELTAERPSLAVEKPATYAIFETGGKQYRVSVGDTLSVEKLDTEAGSEVSFDRVLLVAGDGPARIGTPTVSGASVVATVDEQYRGKKIVVFKYKPKKRYRRRLGHRQSLTRLAITAING